LESQLYKVGIVNDQTKDTSLRNPRVDWGKACEFNVDFNNEVAIRHTGVKDEEVFSGSDSLSLYSRSVCQTLSKA
jgi:hypothetical protein